MKHTIILLIVIVLSSCCGTKKVLENNNSKETSTVVNPKVFPENLNPITTSKQVTEAPKPIRLNQQKPTKVSEPIIAKPEVFDHTLWNDILQKHVSNQGQVDYKALKTDRKMVTNYITTLGKNTPKNTWSKADRLTYWINAYNAMTIDLILRNYPIKSIKDIKNPWEQRLWKLETKWYNLEEIEHQILRKMNEPRIHFAIVCASVSCPKLSNKAYSASHLDAQLTQATKDFLADTKRNNISKNDLKLSKLFQWFSKDFKSNGSVIDFINQYTDIEISQQAKKSYKNYNWDLNE